MSWSCLSSHVLSQSSGESPNRSLQGHRFRPFNLPTCDQLSIGRDHSHCMESGSYMYIVCLLTVAVCGLVCLNYVCLPYIHNYFYYIYLSNYISYTYTGIRIQCTFRGGGRHILYISMLRIRTLVSLFQLRSRLGLYECLICWS